MTEIVFYKKPQYIKGLSKSFRHNQTKTEDVLWEKLKWKQINWLKFHRQKTIFAFREESWLDRFYIADFYCHTKRLIIEIDWWVHNNKNQKEYDEIRDEIFKNNNYTVIRFKNEEVLNNLNWVIEKIKLYLFNLSP